MSSGPSIGGSGPSLVGLGDSASELGFDDSIKSSFPVTNTLADAATYTPAPQFVFGPDLANSRGSSSGQLSIGEDVFATPAAPKMALPGGSARTSIEDGGLANAMAAAQAGSNEINALGSDAYTGIFEPEFVEPTPAEVMASNRRAMAEARADDAANVQPQTFVGGFGADPAPSDIQLEVAQPTGGGLTAGGIADLLEATPRNGKLSSTVHAFHWFNFRS